MYFLLSSAPSVLPQSTLIVLWAPLQSVLMRRACCFWASALSMLPQGVLHLRHKLQQHAGLHLAAILLLVHVCIDTEAAVTV